MADPSLPSPARCWLGVSRVCVLLLLLPPAHALLAHLTYLQRDSNYARHATLLLMMVNDADADADADAALLLLLLLLLVVLLVVFTDFRRMYRCLN